MKLLIILTFFIVGCNTYKKVQTEKTKRSFIEINDGDDIQLMASKGAIVNVHIQVYSLGAGTLHKLKTLEDKKLKIFINDTLYRLQDGDALNLNLKSGIHTLSVINESYYEHPLEKTRIALKKLGVYNISVYLIYDWNGMQKKREAFWRELVEKKKKEKVLPNGD
jgi:hypothetical protein